MRFMKNTFRIILSCFLLITILSIANNAFSWGEVKKAKEFMQAGMYPQAIELLDKKIKAKPTDAEAHFQLGVCFINTENYSGADERFGSAVRLNSDYGYKIGGQYQKIGSEKLNNGQIQSAVNLFEKAMIYQPDLKKKISKQCFEKAKFMLKDLSQNKYSGISETNIKRMEPLFAMACRYTSHFKMDSYNLIMDCGDAADNEVCASYYCYAKKFCCEGCERNIKAGKRLKSIADNFEEKNLFDPRVEEYKKLARKFINLPPNVKIYQRGTYTLPSLKAGEILDYWIAFPVGEIGRYSLSSDDYGYKLIYNDGDIIKDGKTVEYPKKNYPVFKILAITNQKGINMRVY